MNRQPSAVHIICFITEKIKSWVYRILTTKLKGIVCIAYDNKVECRFSIPMVSSSISSFSSSSLSSLMSNGQDGHRRKLR